jgi:hypothetical protein
MGGWEVWLVLIVGAAVWIVGHLLKQSAEEDSKRGPRPPVPPNRRPGAPPGQQPGRPQSSSELDRFLQEVARRKQAAEQQRGREAAQKQQARRPARPGQQTSDRSPRRRADVVPEVIAVEPVRQRATVDRALETTVPVAQPARRVEPPATVFPAEVVEVLLPAAPAASARLFPATRRQTASPTLQKLAGMLHNKDDLRAGILLREILERPLSRRRRP